MCVCVCEREGGVCALNIIFLCMSNKEPFSLCHSPSLTFCLSLSFLLSVFLSHYFIIFLTLSLSYAECHIKATYAEFHFAEFRYAECHYAECRGALSKMSSVN